MIALVASAIPMVYVRGIMIHAVFDTAAAVASFLVTVITYRWRLAGEMPAALERHGIGYMLSLVAGAAVGGYLIGTLNLLVSGIHAIGRSMAGALAGGIAGVELYKRRLGIGGSTGLVFVPAFATSVAVGRLGCFFSGLDDMTFGVPTSLPIGVDFGDGIPRHPVQLYESAAMAAFLAFALFMLGRRHPFFLRQGFYLMVLFYAVQRFCWEFLKPYATILGPFNVFHLVCAGLAGYALWMMRKRVS